MPEIEVLGRICQINSSDEIRELDAIKQKESLLYVISANGKKYAGFDADKYPDCTMPLFDFDIFGIGADWEWYEE